MKKPKWINNIKAIGWDLDGTLYPQSSTPPNIIQNLQYQAVMKANDWEMSKAKAEFQKIYKKLGSHTKTLTALNVDGAKFFTDLWDELPLEQYIHHDSKIIKLFSKLKVKRHFIITNSNTQDQVKRKLKLVGIPISIFKTIVTTDKMKSVKPDPEPFLKALKVMDSKPQETLFVGDRVTTDIRGAKNIGMKTCLVYGESKEADISLENPYQLVKSFN